ncbi:hypothetical protein Bca101_088414 [Brassica carinata]
MASCDNPVGADEHNRGGDDGSDSSTGDEAQNTRRRTKGKRKEVEGGSGSKSRKKNKTTSWVWEHFTRKKDDYDKACCNHCGKEMLCPSKSGTCNMKKHLNFACKGYPVWLAAQKFKDGHGPEGDSSNVKMCKVSDTVIREATNEMMVIGELPLAWVEGLAWRHFTDKIKLGSPHSRRTATRDIVEAYVKKKEAMKKILEENKQRLSLTTDIWVAPHTGASYMVITAHFIDAWWQLKKLIIGFKNVYDHKGATISKALLECLEEWGIKRVFSITVDNATANGSALRRFKESFMENGADALVLGGRYLHLRCATHILNLVVKEGLLEVDNNINAIRNGIYFVRSSTQRQISFARCVESGKIQRGSLPLDVRTRWNSTYLMLEQAMKFRVAFEKMEAEDKPYNDYFNEIVDGQKRIGPPAKEDWEAVNRLVQFLIIFYKATLVLSASNTVCAHKLYHAIYTVTRNISLLSTTPGPDEILRSKASAMNQKLRKYWYPFGDKVEMNKMIIVAGVLDPSKKMKFVVKCFEKLYGEGSVEATLLTNETKDILRSLFDEYNIYVRNNVAAGGQTVNSQSQSRGTSSQSQEQFAEVSQQTLLGNGLAYESMSDIYLELVNEAGVQEKTDELDLYLKESVEYPNLMDGSEYDVLSWWKVNSPKFPVLSTLARDVLAMQVSSVASESAFSTSGRVLDASRSCLTHFMIEVLMCTEQWLKCESKFKGKGVIRKEQMLSELENQDELMREFEPIFKQM